MVVKLHNEVKWKGENEGRGQKNGGSNQNSSNSFIYNFFHNYL